MDIALSEMIVEGISTYIPLQRELLHAPVLIKGGMDIHFLEKKLAARSKKSTD